MITWINKWDILNTKKWDVEICDIQYEGKHIQFTTIRFINKVWLIDNIIKTWGIIYDKESFIREINNSNK